MGKKKSGRSAGGEDAVSAFILRVPMHCRCNGCSDKIRAGVKDLTLHHGIQAVDQSALATKGELKLLATGDPDKLRRRLHKSTGKNVDLVLLPVPTQQQQQQADKDAAKAAAAEKELLEALLLRGGALHPAAQVLPGYAGYGAQAQQQAYQYHHHPWAAAAALHQQQAEAYTPPAYHHAAAYPAAAYAYPQLGLGAYAGGWPY